MTWKIIMTPDMMTDSIFKICLISVMPKMANILHPLTQSSYIKIEKHRLLIKFEEETFKI